MHRIWFKRLTLPLWAVWLMLAVTERPLSFDCWMHETATPRPASAAHSAMHHHTHQGTSEKAGANCCGCLGDCGTAPAAILPSGGEVVAFALGAIAHHAPAYAKTLGPVTRTDLALPYPNAPPLAALI